MKQAFKALKLTDGAPFPLNLILIKKNSQTKFAQMMTKAVKDSDVALLELVKNVMAY